MIYEISGKQINIGDSLQQHVKDSLDAVIAKYAERPTDAHVYFKKDGPEFTCEAIVHLSTGMTTQASANAHEIYAAFDSACDKMEKQLRRYKRRLKDHHKQRPDPIEVSQGSSYILATHDEDASEPDTLQPMIIAEMETKIPSLSVGEAVMQMEISGASVLIFKNEDKTDINVVYRRPDGNVGWVDPQNVA